MKVLVYPADAYGCGHHRLIWPAQQLIEFGAPIEVINAEDRKVRLVFDQQHNLIECGIDPEYEVIVFQRTTDHRLIQVVKWLREQGRTVIIDVDDDLSAIHPANPAFTFLDPHRAEHEVQALRRLGQIKNDQHAAFVFNGLKAQYPHSWNNLLEACKYASLVTVSTPGLLKRYAAHGRGAVLPNYLAAHYFTVEHQDNDLIGWPAALHSHPNDPAATGNAIARMIQDGAGFITIGAKNEGVQQAFGLREEPPYLPDVDLFGWPAELTKLGIGIAPLADTLFNSRKSWLKPLELSAVGVPWVASPRTEYTRLHSLGAGLLAKDARDWYRHLTRLRSSVEARTELAGVGREVADSLRLRDHAHLWWEAWERAYVQDQASAGQPASVG